MYANASSASRSRCSSVVIAWLTYGNGGKRQKVL